MVQVGRGAKMGNPPIKTFKVGGISFSVWENENGIAIKWDGRTYKDKNGEWQKTDYLNRSDIAKLKVAVDNLFEWAFTENIFHKKEDQDPDFKPASEMLKK